ncbi:MAG: tRNA pseudouridine(38-40) synthase TruA [Anaerolinea sp.]|nr:tRNA pseudouridine(38-40) synthase TruA [Anaerolinea sp.]
METPPAAQRIRFRGTLAYDGTAYFGFQRQVDPRTIQGTLEGAIQRVTGQQATVHGAGRTDTGVHASGQVVAFDVIWNHSDDILLKAINAVLPDDIALQTLTRLSGDAIRFHPRYDAAARFYKYTVYEATQRHPLLTRFAWHVRPPLDGEVMRHVSALLVGTHDFAAFGKPPKGDNTVRTLYRSEWTRQPETFGVRWEYAVEGNAFLQHMVRRIVGMVVDVGRGKLTVDQFEGIFRSAALPFAVTVAPPQGLVLEQVKYGMIAGDVPAED